MASPLEPIEPPFPTALVDELQELVDGDPDIVDVAEEIADAAAHRRWDDFRVALSNGLENGPVESFVELKHAAVEVLIRILILEHSRSRRRAAA